MNEVVKHNEIAINFAFEILLAMLASNVSIRGGPHVHLRARGELLASTWLLIVKLVVLGAWLLTTRLLRRGGEGFSEIFINKQQMDC